MISLIHPSRGRPGKAFDAFIRWNSRACTQYEYILSLDTDDPCLNDYEQLFSKLHRKYDTAIYPNRSAIDAINKAAEHATGDIIVVMSDDFDCPNQWDETLINITQDKKDWIAKTHDGIQRWIITLPIMDRIYYNRFGYIYHPEFLHMFCDTQMSCVADLLGKRINLDMKFPHNHYSVGKSERDEISIRADKTWGQGEYTFMKHYRNNFGLVDPPGKITDQNFLNWVSAKR